MSRRGTPPIEMLGARAREEKLREIRRKERLSVLGSIKRQERATLNEIFAGCGGDVRKQLKRVRVLNEMISELKVETPKSR